MKINEVYDEMLDIAKKIGVSVRKESGMVRSGSCTINDQNVIVINNSVPMESKTSMLAKCLSQYGIQNVFMKPAVRDYIEREQQKIDFNDEFQLIIDN